MTAEAVALAPDPEPTPDRAGAVTVGYVYDQDCTTSWHHSMTGLYFYDLGANARVMRGGYIAMHYGTDGLTQARNLGVKTFLEERDADWLWWVDTDMGFTPDVIDRLFEVADPELRPVVGGLCFAQRETGPDGLNGWTVQPSPTLFDWAEYETDGKKGYGFLPRLDYTRDTVTQVAGTGSACILIHRSAFEKVQEKYGPGWFAWYNRVPNPSVGEMTSEDLSFCMRLREAGVPVYVHTGVKTSHQKTIWVDDRVYDRMPPAVPPVPPGLVRWPLDSLRKAAEPPAAEPVPEAVATDA